MRQQIDEADIGIDFRLARQRRQRRRVDAGQPEIGRHEELVSAGGRRFLRGGCIEHSRKCSNACQYREKKPLRLMHSALLLKLIRKLKGQLDLQQPRVVSGFGPYSVVKGVKVQLHGLSAEVKRLSEAAPDRDGPLAAAGDPVRGNLRRRADGPTVGEMVVDEGIEKKLVGAVRAAGWPAKGPDVVDDGAKHPRDLIQLYECRRRAGALREPRVRVGSRVAVTVDTWIVGRKLPSFHRSHARSGRTSPRRPDAICRRSTW